jgi:uncharacterized membrane protein HdeD (DUF308 family)
MEAHKMKKATAGLYLHIVDALALIVLGCMMLIWPNRGPDVVFLWMGIALILPGVAKTATLLIRKRIPGLGAVDLAVGLMQIVLGVLCIVMPEALAGFFPAIAACLLAFGAIVLFAQAYTVIDHDDGSFMLSFALGMLSLTPPVVIFIRPDWLADRIAPAAAASMIVEGIFLLIAVWKAVKANQD